MTLIQIIFYIFSTLAIASATMVVVSSNPVRGALFLVLTFFGMAGVWLLLHAEFLALVLVLVYVGAVMTLFLFVVMMLRVNTIRLREGFVRYLPFGVVLVFMVVAFSVVVLGPKHFGLTMMPAPALKGADYSNISEVGLLMFTDFAYPFEIAGMLLLTGIVAAIALSHHKPKARKIEYVPAQVKVKPAERMRLLQMPSEKKISPSNNEAGL